MARAKRTRRASAKSQRKATRKQAALKAPASEPSGARFLNMAAEWRRAATGTTWPKLRAVRLSTARHRLDTARSSRLRKLGLE